MWGGGCVWTSSIVSSRWYRRMKHVRGAGEGATGGAWWGGCVRHLLISSPHFSIYTYRHTVLPTHRHLHTYLTLNTILSTFSPYTACWIHLDASTTHSLSPSLHSASFTLETDSFRFAGGLHAGAGFVEISVHGLNIPLGFAVLLVPCWPCLVTLGMWMGLRLFIRHCDGCCGEIGKLEN